MNCTDCVFSECIDQDDRFYCKYVAKVIFGDLEDCGCAHGIDTQVVIDHFCKNKKV